MKVCICGGGSLGHVCAGVLSSHDDVQVSILSGKPEQWNRQIEVTDINGRVFSGHIAEVSSNPAEVVAGCDIVFLCLPGFMIARTLERIKPHLSHGAIVGAIVSSTGFFFEAHRILGTDARLFGFQRTPFIARVKQYGHSAHLLGYKPRVHVAVENVPDAEAFRQQVERLWITPTVLLDNFYQAALTNSNPILHTGRLYTMFAGHETRVHDHNILFYREWTDEASQMLIDMDAEFFTLLRKIGVEGIPTLLDYYESHDARSLTQKISSIAAFQSILSPMKEAGGGWVADFESRYFTEDFPYGLAFIDRLCREHGIEAPCISKVLAWGMRQISKEQ
ncbi:MAG: NAD/NADP octopine/nopaline dehydrogenase family protein [Bacteroidales bacterium]|nr:NAD/NADP octopine/nopaline dehydrogenase family protein [Bacteroidales bacterium]